MRLGGREAERWGHRVGLGRAWAGQKGDREGEDRREREQEGEGQVKVSDPLSSLLHEHKSITHHSEHQLTPAPFSSLPLHFVASPSPTMGSSNGIIVRKRNQDRRQRRLPGHCGS